MSANKNAPILLHVGYHKSASTYLQKLFSCMPVNYLFVSGKNRSLLDYVEYSRSFNPSFFRSWVRSELEKEEHTLTVLSHEELSGHPHGYKEPDPFRTALNLKAAYPSAKILFIIRNQYDYILSLYTYRVAIKGSETRNLERFIKEEGESGLFLKLEYDKLIRFYTDLFSEDSVLVLPFEMLKKESDLFHNKLFSFIGCNPIDFKINKINESTKIESVIFFWRILNFPFSYLRKMLGVINVTPYFDMRFRYIYYGIKKRLTAHINNILKNKKKIFIGDHIIIKKQMEKRYKESNLRLYELTGVDIKKYGYPING